MSYPYNLLFIQAFLYLLLSHFFANAATIPTNSSAISDVSQSLHKPDLNSSALYNGWTRCLLPELPLAPVNLMVCQATFRWLLLAPDAEVPSFYRSGGRPIRIAFKNDCAITLDAPKYEAFIFISKKMIVDYARQVLLLCANFGQGGWTHVDGSQDWIVIVSGRSETETLANDPAVVSGSMVSIDIEKG